MQSGLHDYCRRSTTNYNATAHTSKECKISMVGRAAGATWINHVFYQEKYSEQVLWSSSFVCHGGCFRYTLCN